MTKDKSARTSHHLKVLVADTNRYAHAARMAMAFADLGCEIGAICPRRGHPMASLNAVGSFYVYNGFSPLRSLRSAIREFQPDLIVPTCESSVGHLYRLHAQTLGTADRDIADLVERSLGSPASYSVGQNRYELLRIAREEGIPVPETFTLDNPDALARLGQRGGKWALKADGSWGGAGVWMIDSLKAAQRTIATARKKRPVRWLLKQLSLCRGWGFILEEWLQPAPRLTLQNWIDGRPSNCAMACWEGEILAGTFVEVLESDGDRGRATLVELAESPPMLDAARRIARRLGLSGFFGLDFIVENGTGCHYLLEMNPRCSALSGVRLGEGHDLPAALLTRILGVPRAPATRVTDCRRIAYFPRPPAYKEYAGPVPRDCYYDVPRGQPALIERLSEPWPKFSMLRAAKRTVRWVTRKPNKHKIHVWIPSSGRDGCKPACEQNRELTRHRTELREVEAQAVGDPAR
jgi:hypothetical protein